MMDFHDDATINHKNIIIVNALVLYMISLHFSSFEICHLVGQIINLVKIALHAGTGRPWHCQFWPTTRKFQLQKSTVVGIEYKLNDTVTRFSLSTLSEF